MKIATLIVILTTGLATLGYIVINRNNNTQENIPALDLNQTQTQVGTFTPPTGPPPSNQNTQTPPSSQPNTSQPPTPPTTTTSPPVTTTPSTPPSNSPVAQGGGSNCASNDPPSITLISPNGGEAFQSSQQITVTWKSCNISQNDNVVIDLFNANDLSGGNCILNGQTPNDGMEAVNLSVNGCQYLDFQSGGSYKTRVYLLNSPVGTMVQDFSDNSFIIN